MFDGAWPNWWYSLVICACFVGFLFIILHCMIQDLQRDYRKRIKRRQKFEEWKKNYVNVHEKRVWTVRHDVIEV